MLIQIEPRELHMIVVVIGIKGGTGKTTVAVHLAGWRQVAGRDTVLIDADRQETSRLWVERREEFGLTAPQCVQQFGRSVRQAGIGMARRFDDVVIDIGAGDDIAIETVLRIADVGVVPLQPNEFDIWTLPDVNAYAEDAQAINPELRVLAVLNRAPTHPSNKDTNAALAALRQCEGIEASPCVVKERTAIRRVVPTGRLIDETSSRDNQAVSELARVYSMVFKDELEHLATPA